MEGLEESGYIEFDDEFYFHYQDSWWVVLEQDEEGRTNGAEVETPWTLH
jgi:hypothetical protein